MILVDLKIESSILLSPWQEFWGLETRICMEFIYIFCNSKSIYIKLFEIFLVNLWILHQPLFLIMYFRRTKMRPGWYLDGISSQWKDRWMIGLLSVFGLFLVCWDLIFVASSVLISFEGRTSDASITVTFSRLLQTAIAHSSMLPSERAKR